MEGPMEEAIDLGYGTAMEGAIDLGGSAMEEARTAKSHFYACYLLSSMSSHFKGGTYIGFTVDPLRRLRQHNGEIRSGAFRTRAKRPWEMILCVYGFPTQVHALQFEWAWQHPYKSLAVKEAADNLKPLSGVHGRVKLVYTMLSLPEWKSFNLIINFLSTKHISYTKDCPALPPHMRVTIAPLSELPCYQARLSGCEDGKMKSNFNENNTSKKPQRAYKQKRLQSISSTQDPKRVSIKNIRETDESIAESTDIDSVLDPNLSPFLLSRILKHYDENVQDFPGSSCNQLLYDQLVHDPTQSKNVLDSSGINENNISKETQQPSKHRKLQFVSSSKDPKRVSKENLRETDENVVESTHVDSFFDTDFSPFLASRILNHTGENIDELPGSPYTQLVFDLNYPGEDCKRTSPDGRSLVISPLVLAGDSFQSDFSISKAPGSTSTDTTSSSPALPSRELLQSVDSSAVYSSPIKEQTPKRLQYSSLGPCAPCIGESTIAVSPFNVISIASSPESSFDPREIIDLTDSPFLW